MLKYIICIVGYLPVNNEIVHYANNVMKNYVNIITSNQAKRCIIHLFLLKLFCKGPMDLSFEPFIEWKVSMKKFEKSRTIEKYILIYKTKPKKIIYIKQGYIK